MQKPLWIPSQEFINKSEMKRFENFVSEKYAQSFNSYHDFWLWSIDNLSDFWEAIFQFFQVINHSSYSQVLALPQEGFFKAKWFVGAEISYTEHIFRNENADRPAIVFQAESQLLREVSWLELKIQVLAIQKFLIENGITKGDRVVGYLTNSPETIAIFLAVNSLGAIWSCCSPDFGTESIIDRFSQVSPKVLFANDVYQYNGKTFDKSKAIDEISAGINSLEDVVIVDSLRWKSLLAIPLDIEELQFISVAFNDPIWVLYSSGTTGKPKAITHSTGGILLEHFKALALHQNVIVGDRFFWYSTTGWMMWNYAISSLLCGATLCLYEGSPAFPNETALWDFSEKVGVDHFGGGAAYYIHSMKSGLNLRAKSLNFKTIGSTGSPLPIEAFYWLNGQFPNAQIVSLSGGTDVCSAFVAGCPYLPVNAGEIQCRTLGSAVFAYNDLGEVVTDEVGELVIKKPMPSMPVFFWNDNQTDQKYFESYFNNFKNLWSHGDWIKIGKNDGVTIFGRSDATLNRGGVRIGTAEIYQVLDGIEEIKDSLVICLDKEDGTAEMPLFVQFTEGFSLTEEFVKKIKTELRTQFSPRHVPDRIYAVPEIPYTLSGKKMEIPVKRLMMGYELEKAVTLDAMRNPESIKWWLEFREK
ncbi:acetoacetate--CoA ligase [Lacihabitans sp. LS3-19]|uniref:acetoacetate--CoA ligase n=1 Tax=Lacihabitans sp. LS3-19 TaxID=2487335 RepID=UPI0020CD6FA5|nr:acetoacetate--CoA ligase [Lacihabitans sp. LS3-19]MCP9769502.1 acetoacetate--CoA ligase [Lacihabitans sp. LS3-19]